MALKALLESLDGLSEDVKAEYTETDGGKFRLEVEAVDGLALEDVKGLKSTLGKMKRRADDADVKLRAFGDLDPVRAAEAMAQIGELAGLDTVAAADKRAALKVAALKRQIGEKHAAELKTAGDRIDGLTAQLATVMIDQAATKAIGDRKGSIDLLLPHVRALSRLRTDDDGALYVEVVDENGIPRIGDSNGGAMTIDQFVESMRQSDLFARAFDGSGASGGGAPGNPGGPAGRGGAKTVHVGDQAGLNSNLEAIARGELTVTD